MSDKLNYLKNVVYIRDRELTEFAKHNGKTEFELIDDIVEAGFALGMGKDGEFEYWAP